jgi:hypothetical protein
MSAACANSRQVDAFDAFDALSDSCTPTLNTPSGHVRPCKLDLRARADVEKSDGAGRHAGGDHMLHHEIVRSKISKPVFTVLRPRVLDDEKVLLIGSTWVPY